ncbi:MAG TPA: hypothetical protein VHF22_04290 [Planctomycetota bacterium]|nr:hypothetical protein [Planctomycetota bacterium]
MPANPATPVASFILDPRLPEILTEKHWDKNKGLLAKAAGETGVGAALKKLADLFGKVDWLKFQGKTHCQGAVDWDLFDRHFKAAQAENKKAGEMQKQLYAVRDLAKAAAEKFKKGGPALKDAVKLGTDLADTADWYGVMLGSIDAEFKEVKKDWEWKSTESRKLMPASLERLDEYARRTGETPTAKFYVDGEKDEKFCFHQIVRGLAAAIAIQPEPEFKALQKTWREFSVDAFKPRTDGDEVKKKVKAVMDAAPALKKVVAAKVK